MARAPRIERPDGWYHVVGTEVVASVGSAVLKAVAPCLCRNKFLQIASKTQGGETPAFLLALGALPPQSEDLLLRVSHFFRQLFHGGRGLVLGSGSILVQRRQFGIVLSLPTNCFLRVPRSQLLFLLIYGQSSFGEILPHTCNMAVELRLEPLLVCFKGLTLLTIFSFDR